MTTETNTPAVEATKVAAGAATTARGKRAERATKRAPRKSRKVSTEVANRVAKQMGTANFEGKAPTTVAREAKRTAASKAKAPAKRIAAPKDKAPKATGNTFTSVDIAEEHGINAKTLRARIRRNIDKWAPLFKGGEKHVFADNATTRKAIAALLAD